jgi:hypothetical protein
MQTELSAPSARIPVQASDRVQVLADLRQRFVALPDPSSANGWLVDLRDPFHPVTQRYATWAAAQDAATAAIAECLRERFGADASS